MGVNSRWMRSHEDFVDVFAGMAGLRQPIEFAATARATFPRLPKKGAVYVMVSLN